MENKSLGEIFSETVKFLNEFADINQDCADDESPQYGETAKQLRRLANEQLILKVEWRLRTTFNGHAEAAKIIFSLIRKWEKPGSVWYFPRKNRFKLSGDGYSPEKSEICVGIYLSNVKLDILIEDFEFLGIQYQDLKRTRNRHDTLKCQYCCFQQIRQVYRNLQFHSEYS